MQHPILILGSVPLPSPEDVFTRIAGELGDLVLRIPDGETGGRLGFIAWAGDQIANANGVERDPELTGPVWTNGHVFRAKPGVTAAQIDFGPHAYADVALASYAIFRRLRDAGDIPAHVRFQVSLPSAMGIIFSHTSPAARPTLWAAYERHLTQDIRRIVAGIPHTDLAIQWDFATEIDRILEFPDIAAEFPVQALIDSIARLSDPIPPDVELGLHLCYGDPGHKHIIEPKDTGLMVDISNRFARTLRRPIHWIHMPVPKDRDDDAYFVPLRNLALAPETRLYLGLIHLTDGLPGAQRRLATARRFVPSFGLATECGWGRRAPDTIPDLIALHRVVAEYATG
jgi:hypothetical protein